MAPKGKLRKLSTKEQLAGAKWLEAHASDVAAMTRTEVANAMTVALGFQVVRSNVQTLADATGVKTRCDLEPRRFVRGNGNGAAGVDALNEIAARLNALAANVEALRAKVAALENKVGAVEADS